MSSYASKDDYLRATLNEIKRLATHSSNIDKIHQLATEALRVLGDPGNKEN